MCKNFFQQQYPNTPKRLHVVDGYRIKSAIYIIIRYSCDVDRIACLTEEQVDNAKHVADTVVEMLFPPDLTPKSFRRYHI